MFICVCYTQIKDIPLQPILAFLALGSIFALTESGVQHGPQLIHTCWRPMMLLLR